MKFVSGPRNQKPRVVLLDGLNERVVSIAGLDPTLAAEMSAALEDADTRKGFLAAPLRYPDAATAIGISERQLKRWVSEGRIRHIRSDTGRLVCFAHADVAEAIEAMHRGHHARPPVR